MSRPWDRGIHQLRRRIVVSGIVDALTWVLLPAMPAALIYLMATRTIPWTRFFAAYLGLLLLLAVVAAAIVGALTSRRSDIYCAKWIDLESRLEDRLASTVEWSRLPDLDAFQQRCIEQLSLELGARRIQLLLPATRSQRLPLVAASVLVLLGVATMYVYRPAVDVERDAREKAVVPRPILTAAGKDVDVVAAEAVRLQDVELNRVSEELKVFIDTIEKGGSDRETTLKAIDKIRSQIATADRKTSGLGGLSERGQSGPVGALADAITRGDPKGTRAALAQITDMLEKRGLTEDELTDLKPLLEGLASVGEQGSALRERLSEAGRLASGGDQQGAAKVLAATRPELPALDKAIATRAALRRAELAVEKINQTLQPDQRHDGEQTVRPTTAGATNTEGTGKSFTGAGEHTVEDRVADPLLPQTSEGVELSIKGVWNGKVMHALFDGASTGGGNEAVKQILVDHERVVEDRFSRDDIPIEYQEAIRVYFAAIHQKGK